MYLDAVEKELKKVSPGLAGTVWERTSGNALDMSGEDAASWILQVPGAWGWTGSPDGMMPSGAEKPGIKALLDKVRAVISKAERCVDITGFGPLEDTLLKLGPFPDGEFARAMADGLTAAAMAAAKDGRKLKVRVLAGVAGAAPAADPKPFRDELKRTLSVYHCAVDLEVASMTTRGMSSYNHTSLVLVDGRSVIHGGINWRANYYYANSGLPWDSDGRGDWAPVTDVDMALRGPAALSAGRFLDELWEWIYLKASTINEPGKQAWLAIDDDSLDEAIGLLYQDAEPELAGKLDVISVGGLGYGILGKDTTSKYDPPNAVKMEQAACEYRLDGAKSNNETNIDRDFMTVNPDTIALRALIDCARTSIVLSQQDINGYAHAPLYQAMFDVRLFDILAAKMIKGVKVRIVVSNPGSPDYSNIDDIRQETIRPLFNRVRLQTESAAKANEVLKENLQFAPLRVSGKATWLNGHKYRLHTKIVCVDDVAFYIGSRSLYPSTTQDHGFIIEDATAAAQLKTAFLDPEWKYSKNAAIYNYDDNSVVPPQFEDQEPRQRTYPYLDAVENDLKEVSPGLAGTVWERTSGNALDVSGEDPASWILQVPNVWGWTSMPPQGVSKPGVKALLDKIRAVISQAERCVDITGFGMLDLRASPVKPFPDGEFARAMGDGLALAAMAAARDGRRLKVRVLIGVPGFDWTPYPKPFRDELKRMLGSYYSAVDLNVASMTTRGATSYNHTKFILVDGRIVIHGGINWMPNFYYQDAYPATSSVSVDVGLGYGWGDQAPVTDVDMALRGPAALSAGRFLDELWTWTCDNASTTDKRGAPAWLATNNDSLDEAIRTLYRDSNPVPKGELDVIAVGSLGYGIMVKDAKSDYKPPPVFEVEQAACNYRLGSRSNNETNTDRDFMTVNPDASALRALIGCAKTSVVLSQQDINGYAQSPLYHALFDIRLFDILAVKMIKGVKVRIVVSNPGSPDYSNISDIRKEAIQPLFNRVKLRVVDAAKANQVMKENLQFAPLRVSANQTWLNGHKYRLHTKIVCVDDVAFYIGSRNLYPDTTQDHGFIIQDATAAGQLKTAFLDPEWLYSKNAAIYDYASPSLNPPQLT
jgi:phosphatidylserine/phosphatidylglycerophosphate/cardiolipin synthase-like enzyme